jgi:hypothetical protein
VGSPARSSTARTSRGAGLLALLPWKSRSHPGGIREGEGANSGAPGLEALKEEGRNLDLRWGDGLATKSSDGKRGSNGKDGDSSVRVPPDVAYDLAAHGEPPLQASVAPLHC